MKAPKDQRGIALLLTVTITSLVVTASLELNRRVRSAVVATANSRDRVALVQMAAAGVHAAMALLIKDKMTTAIDSIQEDWANPEKITRLLQEIPFEQGTVSVTIHDELSNIQVNALVVPPGGRMYNENQRILWERFLDFMISQHESFNELDPVTFIDSLKDWMDSGDDDAITGLNGAESDYYEALDPPSFCRNGPVPYPAELVRVKGMTPQFYYGTGELKGLSDYITIYGLSPQADPGNLQWEGKININTAPLAVIAALLPPESRDLAEAIVEYRREMEEGIYVHDLTSPTWYKEIPGLSDIDIPPELITAASDLFRIVSTATLQGQKLQITAVVGREQRQKTGKWFCRALSWQVE